MLSISPSFAIPSARSGNDEARASATYVANCEVRLFMALPTAICASPYMLGLGIAQVGARRLVDAPQDFHGHGILGFFEKVPD